MGTPAAPIAPRQVGILILDDDVQSQGALKQILDSEGWRVRVVPDTKLFLAELRTGEWSLVIVNVTITGTDSPLFVTLRELTNVSPEEGGRLRALYMVPDDGGSPYVEPLERAKLPYVLRPFHLHDFLEKVSDLLVEINCVKRRKRPPSLIPCLRRAIPFPTAKRKSQNTSAKKAKPSRSARGAD
jgi:DNA-binding response OmpR family regulator